MKAKPFLLSSNEEGSGDHVEKKWPMDGSHLVVNMPSSRRLPPRRVVGRGSPTMWLPNHKMAVTDIGGRLQESLSPRGRGKDCGDSACPQPCTASRWRFRGVACRGLARTPSEEQGREICSSDREMTAPWVPAGGTGAWGGSGGGGARNSQAALSPDLPRVTTEVSHPLLPCMAVRCRGMESVGMLTRSNHEGCGKKWVLTRLPAGERGAS